MRTRLIILMVFTISFAPGSSQDKWEWFYVQEDFINHLDSNGIDTVGYSVNYYPGWYIANEEDDCNWEGTYYDLYIFWIENGINHLKNFNSCNEYQTLIIDSSVFFQYFLIWREDILNEEIMPAVESIEINNNGDTIFTDLAITDESINDIFVKVNKISKKFRFTESYLSKEYNKIYYDNNINSKAYHWKTEIDDFISQIELRKEFKKK